MIVSIDMYKNMYKYVKFAVFLTYTKVYSRNSHKYTAFLSKVHMVFITICLDVVKSAKWHISLI